MFSLCSRLRFCLIVMSVAFTIAYLDARYWGYTSALVCLGIGWNFLCVGGTALLSQQYDKQESFTVQAMNDFCVFSTQAIMSLSAGWVVFNYGWFALNLIAVPLLMFALIMLGRWYFLSL